MKRLPIQKRLVDALKKHGEKIAVEYGEERLTYTRLDEKSLQVARRILGTHIKPGTFIGVYLAHRSDFISVIIGVLRASCLFVPLDPVLPMKRIAEMLKTTDTDVLIADEDNLGRLRKQDTVLADKLDILPVEELLSAGQKEKEDADGPLPAYDPEGKIYIYFTSGTTGTPRAIVGKNKSLAHFVDWEIETFQIGEGTRFSQFTTIGFDALLRDVFVPLCAGGTVCIPHNPDVKMNGDTLIEWIDATGIEVIHCVPSLFRVFNTPELQAGRFPHLKNILLSGEKINPTELENWYRAFGERIQLVNFYGPTETTMIKTFYFIRESDARRERIPVGTPMKGARVVLLDKDMEICGKGMMGEIYIRTPYMTHGYYNDDAANRERFIPNPFSGKADDLFYKTGDL
ncbi:MAG: amino acid adenylation domain-containing protein, partial [bacterium]|nr:amino acid adenylation domain-containing protein [bacterium]